MGCLAAATLWQLANYTRRAAIRAATVTETAVTAADYSSSLLIGDCVCCQCLFFSSSLVVPLRSLSPASSCEGSDSNSCHSSLTSSSPNSLLSLALSKAAPRRQRGEKKPIPDMMKDDRYFERRKRNSLAAKKSRDQRKIRYVTVCYVHVSF